MTQFCTCEKAYKAGHAAGMIWGGLIMAIAFAAITYIAFCL